MRRASSERGSGLVMSLMATAMFAIVTVTVYSALRYMSRESVYYLRSAQAHEEAEAGLEDALYNLRMNNNWRAGFNAKPFAEGYYTVTLTGGDPPTVASTSYFPRSISAFGRLARTIQVQAPSSTRVNLGQPFHRGLGARQLDGKLPPAVTISTGLQAAGLSPVQRPRAGSGDQWNPERPRRRARKGRLIARGGGAQVFPRSRYFWFIFESPGWTELFVHVDVRRTLVR